MSSPLIKALPAAARVASSCLNAVTQALRLQQRDYTAESVGRAMIFLAVPMVIEMSLESLFALVDIFWVSRLGHNAVAVVGITESVMTLIYAVAIGTSFAATAIVARRIGEGDPERAAQSAGQIMILGLASSAGLGLLFGYFAADILRLMGADASIVALGSDFARIMLGGNATVFVIFLINAIFRGAGDAALAMRTLLLANALNVVLAPCFIFGLGPFPEMGVTGAAVATNIGRGIGVFYQLWHLAGHHSRVRVGLRHLRPAPRVLKAVFTTASNGVAQLLISTTSWIGVFKILALFGSAALAGYTISIRIAVFALMPAYGLASAGAILVGQNLGALRPERAEAAVRIAVRFNVMLLTLVGTVFAIFASTLLQLFTTDPDVLIHGVRALRITALAFPFYAAGMCWAATFNGAGDTWTPTRLNFFCFWFGQIPLAWILARPLNLGPLGVFIAVPISVSMLALWSGALFKQGKWKLQKV